jgi:hypothetical protein
LAAHLLGIAVRSVRIGREHDSDSIAGVVQLVDPDSVTDPEWELIASAGVAGQTVRGVQILPEQSSGDQRLLSDRGLHTRFVPCSVWLAACRPDLDYVCDLLFSHVGGAETLVDGAVLHRDIRESFGIWTVDEALAGRLHPSAT